MRYQIVYNIYLGCCYFFRIIEICLILRAILSWILRPDNRVYMLLVSITEPFLSPFRRVINKFVRMPMMIDLSFILCYFVLQLLPRVLYKVMLLFL